MVGVTCDMVEAYRGLLNSEVAGMRRIISVIGLALVIGALTAASASAVPVTHLKVKAPNASNTGLANGNPPDRVQRACVPNNQGTSNAAGNSPAINGPCFINNF